MGRLETVKFCVHVGSDDAPNLVVEWGGMLNQFGNKITQILIKSGEHKWLFHIG